MFQLFSNPFHGRCNVTSNFSLYFAIAYFQNSSFSILIMSYLVQPIRTSLRTLIHDKLSTQLMNYFLQEYTSLFLGKSELLYL